ncbi:MAG: hypothetical protein RL007_949 [Bacteroidota bacterium]|jgi:peptidylprolyl isomerase
MKKSALILFAALAGFAFYSFSGTGKDKDPKPSDNNVRKWKSTPIKPKKQKTVVLACGIEYTITHKGNGPLPKLGDRVSALYTGKLMNDTVFDASSRHGNQPFSFHPGKGGEVIGGWDSVFKYLHAGDRAVMKLPAKYAYGPNARPGIPANSDLRFEVEVLDVVAAPMKWDAAGKDTITTPSGLKIVMFEKHPDSAMAKKGQNVTVDYSGYLLDGKMFDSSVDRGQPFMFPLGMGRVIAGWDEGIGLLHEGEKAQLIIPYQLAYGAQGRPPIIPPKATLIFDVHLINIK